MNREGTALDRVCSLTYVTTESIVALCKPLILYCVFVLCAVLFLILRRNKELMDGWITNLLQNIQYALRFTKKQGMPSQCRLLIMPTDILNN